MSQGNDLSQFERYVIEQAGTEPAFSGQFTYTNADGIYACKRCDAPLYRSNDKFDSGCGWPSFDDAIEGAIVRRPDPDGVRTEIVCEKCKAHLGHVFEGEEKTPKNVRHCVNSVSLNFHAESKENLQEAIFASGCFWGTQYFLARSEGVVKTLVGYTGGHVENPTYEQVCSKKSGHLEAVKVVYDPNKISYRDLAQMFFETHDFSQEDGQGPDIGPQYQSAIFVQNEQETKVANELISQLSAKGYHVATKVRPSVHFWEAEAYHQNYYERKGDQPYCHRYRKLF